MAIHFTKPPEEYLREITRAFLDQGAEGAEAYLREHIRAPRAAAERQAVFFRAVEEKGLEVIRLLSPELKTPTAMAEHARSMTEIAEARDAPPAFREQVIGVAKEMAALAGTVLLTDLLAELRRRGVQIPGLRPGTSVGNIMLKATGWKRVAVGCYAMETHQE